MALIKNRFIKGSGLYRCRCCDRNTRSTGNGDNEHVQLCVDCYDLAGYENMVSDGEELTSDIKSDIINVVAHLAKLGAKVDQWDELLAQAKEAS